MEIHAPSLLSVWSLRRTTTLEHLERLRNGTGLGVRVVVRGHTIAAGARGPEAALRVSWSGVLRSFLALLPGGDR